MTIRVACVGGGPGGLFFSTLLKRQMPSAEVVLFERNQATDAFGFGVVFSDATLEAINEADPVLRDGLRDHGKHWSSIEVWLKGEKRQFAGNGMAAIHRRTLLPLLQERALDAGVTLKFGQNVPGPIALREEFDVVVGADGANSRTRQALIDELGHTTESATAKFIWFGTTHHFEGLTFVHRQSEFGNFAAHAYPISDELSTFIVETDEQTWRRAGLDEFDTSQPPGISDTKTQQFLAELFAEDLADGSIVANNSRWATFQTRRTTRWHKDNVVLLGDAVHTAHFSVGSGTKMAMEDGIVLAQEIAAHPESLQTAFTNYETQRMPKVAKIQRAASGGVSWWEHFGRYYQAFEPTQFAFHFFSRSIGIDKMEQRDPQLVKAARSEWLDKHGASALDTPLALGETNFASRQLILKQSESGSLELQDDHGNGLPVSSDASVPNAAAILVTAREQNSEIKELAQKIADSTKVILIAGGTSLNRTLLSEELRLGRGLRTVIVQESNDVEAETLILSGRTDAVAAPITSSIFVEVSHA